MKNVSKHKVKKTRGNDWEKIAKQLQTALTDEIKETEFLEKKIDLLLEELTEASDTTLMLRGIIAYLENKLERGNHPV